MTKPPGSKDERRRLYSPASRRAHAHESAHEVELAPATDVPRGPMIPQGPAPLIATNDALGELVAHLRSAGSFAYDSEFIGELTYIPKLCVLQAATTERVALIDPLVPGLNLRPFWELLTDASVEKVVHAGQQDVEPVIRHTGRPPANVFDTQIAAGFAGMVYPTSLSKLVQELVGARLGKGLTFTHWDQRPLSASQLRYAADDVRYLPAARAALRARLEKLGHVDWAREEFEALCDPAQYGFDPKTYYLKVRGATSLAPQGMAILRELTIWRDGAARAHDVPARSLVKDEVLVDLSRQPVKSVEKLDRVRGLPRPVEHAHGAEIVEATVRALAMPTETFPQPRHIEPSPSERFGADGLWAAAQCLCIGQSVDPGLATSRQEVGELYRHIAAKPGQPEPELRLLRGWRRRVVVEPLTAMMRGEGELTLNWDEDGLRARHA
ncbi:MAG: ribonuclease D [Tepidisphaeraceae bacterium]